MKSEKIKSQIKYVLSSFLKVTRDTLNHKYKNKTCQSLKNSLCHKKQAGLRRVSEVSSILTGLTVLSDIGDRKIFSTLKLIINNLDLNS